jgi:hypothetical protein
MQPERIPDKVRYPLISRELKNKLKDSALRYPYHVFENFLFHLKSRKFYGQTAEDALLQRLLPEKEGTYFDVGGATLLSSPIPMLSIDAAGPEQVLMPLSSIRLFIV